MTRQPSITRLLLVAILVITVSTQPVFLLGAGFLQMGGEFGFGATGLGALTSAFFLSASLSSVPLGRVVERIGWQRSMRINVVVSAAIALLIALFAQSVAVLAGLLVAAGIVYGLANPAANRALADHVDPRRRGVLFGLKHAGIPASSLVAGLAVPFLILTVGWRWSYVAAALLGIIVLVLVPAGTVGATASRFAPDPRRQIAPMTAPLLAGLAAGSALATWAAIALSTYLVAGAVDVGFSEAAAGLLLFLGSAISITARVAVGAWTDRVGGRGFGAMASMMGVGSIVFVGLGFAAGAWFALLVFAGFATGWAWPGLMTYTVVNANTGSAAASSAITQAGVFVGAGAGPLILGLVIDAGGFDAAWLAVAGALAVGSLAVSAVGRRAIAAPTSRVAGG